LAVVSAEGVWLAAGFSSCDQAGEAISSPINTGHAVMLFRITHLHRRNESG
jgi:hypothetical protein